MDHISLQNTLIALTKESFSLRAQYAQITRLIKKIEKEQDPEKVKELIQEVQDLKNGKLHPDIKTGSNYTPPKKKRVKHKKPKRQKK